MKNKLDISSFFYDRSEPTDVATKKLKLYIEDFVSREGMLSWFSFFGKKINLPDWVLNQYVKSYLANNFNFNSPAGFSNRLCLHSLAYGFLMYVGFCFKVFFKRNTSVVKKVKAHLVIDQVELKLEFDRFSKLIDFFGEDNVVIIVPGHQQYDTGCVKYLNRPRYVNYDLSFGMFARMLSWAWVHLVYSIRCKVNLFFLSGSVINSYLYYKSMFGIVDAKYYLQLRQYSTNSIKNYLFHEGGGRCSATLQKNIHQWGPNGFFFDSDIFFSLGEATAGGAIDLGARFGRVVPVGSFHMESLFFDKYNLKCPLEKKYHLVYMGDNIVWSMHDTYDAFRDDYEEHLKWLVRLADEKDDWIIAVKHHPNFIGDLVEDKILRNTRVKQLDCKLNSYVLSFQSYCIATFASTLAYEMAGHGVPAMFMDPEDRNRQFVPHVKCLKDMHVTNYKDFKHKVEGFVMQPNNSIGNDLSNSELCLDSRDVSNRIYDTFKSM